jgi:Methyltransferase domain
LVSADRRNPVPLDSQTTREIVELFGRRAVPDLRWLERVCGRSTATLLPYVREVVRLLPMERSIRRILAKSGRTYYAQFPAPLDLYVITRILRPHQVVESGVSSGLSSAHMLAALERNRAGVLHSIDLPQRQKGARRARGELSWSLPRGRQSGWAIPGRLTRRWDLRNGKTEDLLPALLEEIPRVDLFCHDSPWTSAHLAFELEAIRPKLHPGSIVVADNTDANPAAVRRLAKAFGSEVRRRGSSSLVGIRIP